MRRAQIAQSILELVTTKDRAASTVGDLVEESQAHNALWFWAAITRIVASSIWGDFRAALCKVLVLALVAYPLSLSIVLLIAGVYGVVLEFATLGQPPHPSVMRGIELAAAFFVGRWAARRVPGREIAIAFAMMAMDLIMGLGVLLVAKYQGWTGDLGLNARFALNFVVYFATAVYTRKRTAIL